jgi:NAD(P)-dependent dehydrogenase (short-subunit alcohol dehydrogenase family)
MKVALVVGAGPGIGRACAVGFARAGYRVAVAARREEPLGTLAGEVGAATSVEIVPFVADLAKPTSCVQLVDAVVARFGRLDALVSVATVTGGMATIDQADWDSWRHAFETNVIGTLEVSRCAARAMVVGGDGSGGAIVHIATFGMHSLPPRQAAYTATKQAALSAATTLAKELGPSGVRVNVVTPGYTTGPNLDALFASVAERTGEDVAAVSRRLASTAALRRHVDPEDIAAAVLFLCSDAACNITGIELPVTGGQHPL